MTKIPERRADDHELELLRDLDDVERVEDVQALDNAARAAERPVARLLAVSKTKPPEAIRALAEAGQRAFGENYVQEAVDKIRLLKPLGLEWHLIGHLQSNKCRDVAEHFDWVQSLDRAQAGRTTESIPEGSGRPLDVLIQVNPDGEAGKSGCDPAQIETLAALVAQSPNLRLRGLMAIPEPSVTARSGGRRSVACAAGSTSCAPIIRRPTPCPWA